MLGWHFVLSLLGNNDVDDNNETPYSSVHYLCVDRLTDHEAMTRGSKHFIRGHESFFEISLRHASVRANV